MPRARESPTAVHSLSRTSPVATRSNSPVAAPGDRPRDRGARESSRPRSGPRALPTNAGGRRNRGTPRRQSRKLGAKGLPTENGGDARRPQALAARVPLLALRHRDSRSAHNRSPPPFPISRLAPPHRTPGYGSRCPPTATATDACSLDNSPAAQRKFDPCTWDARQRNSVRRRPPRRSRFQFPTQAVADDRPEAGEN
jgi:hypothetical protein